MPELLAFGDCIRTVKNVEFRAEAATVTPSGMPRPASRSTLRQVPPQLDGLAVCGIGELVDRLITDADRMALQPQRPAICCGDQPCMIRSITDWRTCENRASLRSRRRRSLEMSLGDAAVIAAVFGKFGVMKGVALQLAIERRTMAPELPGDLGNRELPFEKLMQASAIG